MRKNSKMVAVVSAAALMAIGASMTSFAATGWVEEGGQWFYYDKDGNRVEDEWKKSGDQWYWLDSEENGAMAVDKLVEDDDDTYYVDYSGVMVTNTWVKVVNEDQDDDNPADFNYYYMQANGKAYKASESSSTKFRTIDGKKYAFDEDGKMLYGWVNDSSEMLTDEDGWANNTDGDVYYCGEWDDGSMKTGWQKLNVADNLEDNDEKDFWFYFQSNGKRYYNKNADENYVVKTINGKKYGFDERGVMVYQWNMVDNATGSNASVNNWQYFSHPEDGARATRGWFKVVAANEDNTFYPDFDTNDSFDVENAEDEEEKWYYADGHGELYNGEIKKVNGKYYGFAPEGYMLDGLVFMTVNADGTINTIYDNEVDADDLDDIMDDEADGCDAGATLYYFGDADDGEMKTGTTNVYLDGDTYQFNFKKTGSAGEKGAGLTGIDDGKYIYKYGQKMKADTDDKYVVIYADGDVGDDNVTVYDLDSSTLRVNPDTAENKDNDTVRYTTDFEDSMYLVGTSGSIVKTKSAAKDGDDWYFYVDGKNIKLYANNKTLPESLKDWKNLSAE